LNTNETARVRELEKENARLKRLLAEQDLEVDIVKEIFQKSSEGPRSAGRSTSGGFPSRRKWPFLAQSVPLGESGAFQCPLSLASKR